MRVVLPEWKMKRRISLQVQASFRLASTATIIAQAVLLSDIGREYLRLARAYA